jgi:hypothetical protein
MRNWAAVLRVATICAEAVAAMKVMLKMMMKVTAPLRMRSSRAVLCEDRAGRIVTEPGSFIVNCPFSIDKLPS